MHNNLRLTLKIFKDIKTFQSVIERGNYILISVLDSVPSFSRF